MILQQAGFYVHRSTSTQVRDWRVAISPRCYRQTDSVSCGAFMLQTIQSLLSEWAQGVEPRIHNIRSRMELDIWRFRVEASTFVFRPGDLLVPWD
ncbi:hypothetical protein OROMI_034700 [Orobanche minor]